MIDLDEANVALTANEGKPGTSPAASRPGLCDLHLGLDGQAQGGADRRTGRWSTSSRRCAGAAIDERDALLAVTTLSFDIAALEIFLPLIVGARVELVDREVADRRGPTCRRLNDQGITFLQATPATWRMLLEAGWQRSTRR